MASRTLRTVSSRTILLIAGTAVAFPLSASAADPTKSGTIKGFECGDSCYLTLDTGEGELTGLCVADACSAWNEAASMPDEMIGKHVRVTVGKGQQLDADGNVMGDFPAFTEIVVTED